MTNASHLITYTELTTLYGHKAANDLLVCIEQAADVDRKVVPFCKQKRLETALLALDLAVDKDAA
ncbi:hypothetical protein [Paludibacterium sp.]|uniref:hypothetical protein n=1 Tax=Paludibacterium sp. TaxID=1917523 RepID=UPI0025DFCA24|nr:hypothetical protein [Paludibacterium sp.]MBV8647847.1 hypothetical protein [Paludibacterium sp.]